MQRRAAKAVLLFLPVSYFLMASAAAAAISSAMNRLARLFVLYHASDRKRHRACHNRQYNDRPHL